MRTWCEVRNFASQKFCLTPVYFLKNQIKHYTAVINAVWISISNPDELFQNPVQSGSGSELQNPVGSRSGNRIMFNTAVHWRRGAWTNKVEKHWTA